MSLLTLPAWRGMPGLALACMLLGSSSCRPSTATGGSVTVESLAVQQPATTATNMLLPTPPATLPLQEATATFRPAATPFGCWEPPPDYTRINIRGFMLSQRTFAMLQHAQSLYGGSHDFTLAITQGSYNEGVEASFGTHDGGGAVDLALRDLTDWHNILYDESNAIISALRQAGFAAWVRDTGELYAGSPVHIHAIAVGDEELSQAARDQLDGPAGYFRGFNGLPVDPPIPDAWGKPVVCPWMKALGYHDMRE